jgi:hypothetical protein
MFRSAGNTYAGRADRHFRNGTASACICFMMDVALSIFALVAGGVTLELFTVARAPVGYQDERGFHFGSESKDDTEIGNPS